MNRFDAIVVGAGLSGVLLATKWARQMPGKRMALLERQPDMGGRLRTSDQSADRWGFGLGTVSEALYRHLDFQLKLVADGPDLPELGVKPLGTYGVLAAGKMATVPFLESAGAKGAKALAGASAAKEWTVVDQMLSREMKDGAFGHAWPLTRKAPAALVLEHYTRALGVSDMWTAPVNLVVEALKQARETQYAGHWEQVLHQLLEPVKESVSYHGNSHVAQAHFSEGEWTLQTESGSYAAPVLVVAQSPWEAIAWLPKEYWPAVLIPVATKAKPVSLLVLSERMTEPADLPDLLMIPAEDVQARVLNGTEICYQATLDFELTMQAPNVVKAVKRLKRARAKLHASFPDLKVDGEHLALVPVGWSQVAVQQDRRFVEKLGQKSFQQKHLMFVGDAYGAHEVGDKNLLQSVDDACATQEISL